MSERITVLVVDDEPLNRELLRRVLHASYEVEEAEDAQHAVVVLERCDSIGLVLCDHLMPGANGTELAAIVRQRWPDVPVLLLTGYDCDDEVVQAQRAGLVRQVVGKPWRARALRETIADTLAAVAAEADVRSG